MELIVSVSIFAILTAMLVSRFRSFNDDILLTNTAYDMALTIRTAQSYAHNTKSLPTSAQNYSNNFQYSYGVHFHHDPTSPTPSNSPVPNDSNFILFADKNFNLKYDDGEEVVIYGVPQGDTYWPKCVRMDDAGCPPGGPSLTDLDIIFTTTDADALINPTTAGSAGTWTHAEILLTSYANLGGSKKVVVRKTGHVTVSQYENF